MATENQARLTIEYGSPEAQQQLIFSENQQDALPTQSEVKGVATAALFAPQPPIAPTPPVLVQPQGGGLLQKQKKTQSTDGRVIISIAFTAQEAEYLKQILEARKESKLSNSMHHMCRQMVNYAANWEEGWKFGRPDIDRVILEK